jgi:RNA 3'-phosphate cyclase
MIEIDGKIGGGQILRTGIGLSALVGEPCTIKNVRALRPKPGIKEQHLQGIRAIAKLCDGELVGAELGSKEVMFRPGKVKSGNISVNIGTAGSVGLVTQALLLPGLASKGINIKIKGGATFGKWAPPMQWMQHVFFPLLGKMGYQCEARIVKHGYYPQGGAEVEVAATPGALKPLRLMERSDIREIHGVSNASAHLQKQAVAERQMKTARELVFSKTSLTPKIKTEYVDSLCPGSGIVLWAECDESVIGADALGERGKRAEDVGSEAGQNLLNEIMIYSCVGAHAADNLIPYLAFCPGESGFKTSRITDHVKTNILVAERFLDAEFEIAGNAVHKKTQ